MDPVLSVIILTYNQEKYIGQAIESALMQKTNFYFEVLIGDDCSTDATSDIVKSYAAKHADIIRIVSSSSNVGALRNEKRLMENAKGKYLAFLEGDDFWNDAFKLQKQVDFLEGNPDYGLVHGDVNHLYEENGIMVQAYNKTNHILIPEGFIFAKLLAPAHLIKTMTTCFRKELVIKHFNYDVALERGWLLTDLPLWLDISMHSKIHYIDEVLATYRLRKESASQSKSMDKKFAFYNSVFDVFDYYTQKYRCDASALKVVDQYKFKTLARFSLIYADLSILKKLVVSIRASNRRLNMKSSLIYTMLRNRVAFRFLSKKYNKLRNAN